MHFAVRGSLSFCGDISICTLQRVSTVQSKMSLSSNNRVWQQPAHTLHSESTGVTKPSGHVWLRFAIMGRMSTEQYPLEPQLLWVHKWAVELKWTHPTRVLIVTKYMIFVSSNMCSSTYLHTVLQDVGDWRSSQAHENICGYKQKSCASKGWLQQLSTKTL